MIEAENDKNAVIALREIAEKTIAPGDAREGLIHSMQSNVEIDEPEQGVAPVHPRPPMLGGDHQSADTVVDVITEDQLLRGLESLTADRPICERWSFRTRKLTKTREESGIASSVLWLLPELPLFLIAAVATHMVGCRLRRR